MNIDRFKPVIRQRYLLLFAGLMWMGVGIMLCTMAIKWLVGSSQPAGPFAFSGVTLALIIHHFGFLRIVDKNLGRIKALGETSCAFAFMSWRSYLLVGLMMTLGITLKHSSLPSNYLSVIYLSIGLSLFLSSIRYFRFFMKEAGATAQESE